MDELNWKNRLAVLWILQALNFIAVLVMPDAMAAVVAEMGDIIGLVIAIYFVILALMLWLAVFTKPKVSRWPMLVVGALFGFVKIQWIISALTGEMIAGLLINEVWGFAVAVLTVWYAWKAPKPQAA
jgi:hypothetical protein